MVSVIIPTYKTRGGLINAVNSVLNQSYADIEVIVVDDNEPNSIYRQQTESEMDVFANVPQVHYLKHPENRNGSAARNTGLRYSKGNYISFLDDDDVFYRDKIKYEIDFLETHPDFNCVYCKAKKWGKEIKVKPYEGDVSKELLLMEGFFQTSTLCFRKSALLEIDGFDESFRRHQDYEMLLRYFEKGNIIGCVDKILVELGVNEGENIPSAENFLMIKESFFEKFEKNINSIETKAPGFRKRLYAKHYAWIFLAYIKERKIQQAFSLAKKYFLLSPESFSEVIYDSIIFHIKRLFENV